MTKKSTDMEYDIHIIVLTMNRNDYSEKTFSSSFGGSPHLICSICREQVKSHRFDWYEYGLKHHIQCSNDNGYPICTSCYQSLPISVDCRTCKQVFPSRNLLFKHLNLTGHST